MDNLDELKAKIKECLEEEPVSRFNTFVYSSGGVTLITTSDDYTDICRCFKAQKEAYDEQLVNYIYDVEFDDLLDYGELPQTENDLPIEIVEFEDSSYNTTDDYEMVNHPSHYCFGKYEPRKVIRDWKLNFNLGNAVKYISRAGKKPDNSMIQDLLKAKQYLEFEIEELENGEN